MQDFCAGVGIWDDLGSSEHYPHHHLGTKLDEGLALLSSKSAHDLCIEWLVATVKGGVGAIHPRSTYENLGMGNSYSWLNIFA
ncbi:MAG: hypothetical protein QXL96_02125 [Ignisphaera sp.]